MYYASKSLSLDMHEMKLKVDFIHFNCKVEKQCQGEGYTLTTRDDGEPICYYYIDDVESDGDKYLDYYQSKARCEQRGKKSGRTTRVCK